MYFCPKICYDVYFFYMVKMCKQIRKQLVFMGKIKIQSLHWRMFGRNQKMSWFLHFLHAKSVSKIFVVFILDCSTIVETLGTIPKKFEMLQNCCAASTKGDGQRVSWAITAIPAIWKNPRQLKNPGPITTLGNGSKKSKIYHIWH